MDNASIDSGNSTDTTNNAIIDRIPNAVITYCLCLFSSSLILLYALILFIFWYFSKAFSNPYFLLVRWQGFTDIILLFINSINLINTYPLLMNICDFCEEAFAYGPNVLLIVGTSINRLLAVVCLRSYREICTRFRVYVFIMITFIYTTSVQIFMQLTDWYYYEYYDQSRSLFVISLICIINCTTAAKSYYRVKAAETIQLKKKSIQEVKMLIQCSIVAFLLICLEAIYYFSRLNSNYYWVYILIYFVCCGIHPCIYLLFDSSLRSCLRRVLGKVFGIQKWNESLENISFLERTTVFKRREMELSRKM